MLTESVCFFFLVFFWFLTEIRTVCKVTTLTEITLLYIKISVISSASHRAKLIPFQCEATQLYLSFIPTFMIHYNPNLITNSGINTCNNTEAYTHTCKYLCNLTVKKAFTHMFNEATIPNVTLSLQLLRAQM